MNGSRPGVEPGQRPLDGVVVLDLTRHLPGPLTVRLLRDLGARTIKVEEPERGDPVREAPPFGRDGESALGRQVLAGCESVAVDLKRPEGIALVTRLAERADILVESSRPGTWARLGLDFETLRERNPRLVVCSISGWGADGWRPERSGHDLTYQAAAGLLDEQTPRAPVADVLAAWTATTAILAALLAARQRGTGTHLDLGIADAAAFANLVAFSEVQASGRAIGVLGGRLPCYRIYRCRDGRSVAVGALELPFWESLCRVVGRLDLLARQFDPSESAHREVEALFARRPAAAWVDELRAADVPIELVATPEEALEHPWLQARGLVRDGDVAFPVLFDGRSLGGARELGQLGAATAAVTGEAATDAGELRHFRRATGARRLLFGRLRRWWTRRRVKEVLG